MEKNTVIIVALVILVLVSVVQAVQISNIKTGVTGSAVKVSSGAGETYEEMMARMHPEQAAQAIKSAPSQSAMVGGC